MVNMVVRDRKMQTDCKQSLRIGKMDVRGDFVVLPHTSLYLLNVSMDQVDILHVGIFGLKFYAEPSRPTYSVDTTKSQCFKHSRAAKSTEVGSGRNSYPSKIFWLTMFLPRMQIRSTMKTRVLTKLLISIFQL